MKDFLRQTLERQILRLQELDALLSAADVVSDLERFRKLTREHAEVGTVVEQYRRLTRREADLSQAQAMLGDEELRELAQEEAAAAKADVARLDHELQLMLIPKDPDDARPAFVEIRAGTGGDESALFAGDLLRMYTRYAEGCGWRCELISASPSELGGYKEAVLRIDTFRASGAGGQHVNKTDSAVRITHLPTGIVAECQDDRSQHRNKARALQVLSARIQEKERSERAAKDAALRKGLIGSGDRSDRIRTYNFPQGRLSDHRINLTLYKLAQVMEGDLADVIAALQVARGAELLADLEGAQP